MSGGGYESPGHMLPSAAYFFCAVLSAQPLACGLRINTTVEGELGKDY